MSYGIYSAAIWNNFLWQLESKCSFILKTLKKLYLRVCLNIFFSAWASIWLEVFYGSQICKECAFEKSAGMAQWLKIPMVHKYARDSGI